MSAVMEEKTFRGLREIALLGILAVALFLLISLVTFSNEDAGWTHSGAVQAVTNACGLFGAWIADFTLSFFGLVAYLFPVIITWHGYLLYGQRRQNQQKMTIAFQWLGSIATIVSGAALFYLYVLRVGVELPGSTGGILGQEIGDSVLILFGNSGATLFLIVLLLSGITLATDLSWVTLIDLMGEFTLFVCSVVCHAVSKLFLVPRNNAFKALDNHPEMPQSKKKSTVKAEPIVENGEQQNEKFRKLSQKPSPIKYGGSEGVLPSLALLDQRESRVIGYSQADLEEMSRLVEDILGRF